MRVAALVLGLAACNGGDDDTDTVPTNGGSGDDCGESAPVIESLVVSADGMSEGDVCGGESRPIVSIEVDGHDDDGDLHFWWLRVWWDDQIDGAIDTSTAYQEVQGTAGDACAVHDLTSAMRLCVTGNPPFSTELEWGVVLMDDLENPSNGGEPEIAVFTTPDEQGNTP